jgi:hypothetical protein
LFWKVAFPVSARCSSQRNTLCATSIDSISARRSDVERAPTEQRRSRDDRVARLEHDRRVVDAGLRARDVLHPLAGHEPPVGPLGDDARERELAVAAEDVRADLAGAARHRERLHEQAAALEVLRHEGPQYLKVTAPRGAAAMLGDRALRDALREDGPVVVAPGGDVEERQREIAPVHVGDPRNRGVRHELEGAGAGGDHLLRDPAQADLLTAQVAEHGLHRAEVRRAYE